MERSKDIASHIYSSLRRDIIHLEIKPGQILTESQICDMYSASRTPVHVALQRLADTGLLEILPYKGVRPTLLRFSDVRQSIVMRIVLETKALHDFMDLNDPFALEECNHILRKQQIVLDTLNLKASDFYALDAELHKVWFTYSGLPKIWEIIQESEVYYTRFRMLDIVQPHHLRDIVREHGILLDLVRGHDKAGVAEVVDYHLFGGIRRMKDQLLHEYLDFFEDGEDMKGSLEKIRDVQRPAFL